MAQHGITPQKFKTAKIQRKLKNVRNPEARAIDLVKPNEVVKKFNIYSAGETQIAEVKIDYTESAENGENL